MSDPPCLARQLSAALDTRADHLALDEPGGPTWTIGDLWQRAATMVAVLHEHGVTSGDRVLVQVPKSADALALYLACVRLGAVCCPVNPASPAAETDAYVADADPALVVVAPDAHRPRAPRTLTLGTHGQGSLAAAADAADARWDVTDRGPDELAALLFTSGTTGRPKAAMITDANLVTNARALHAAWHWRPDDVLVHVLPMFHVHGLFVAAHCALLGGSSMIWLPRFDIDTVLTELERATVLMAVPTHYGRLLADDRLDRDRCRHMRLFTSGSAPMTEATHGVFTARTGHRIVERYGMTETGIITSNPYDGERIPGTVGFPLDGVEVRIDRDGGDADGPGVVEVRGPGVCAGYWQRPEATAASRTPDGWFVTGDVGSLDTEGRLRLEGRAGDMIISGGENVYPREVEQALDEVPGVRESAVVGVADDDLGERVVAVLVTDADDPPSEHEVRAALDGRLARFKHPKRIVWVDALPRNTMGKVQKHRLRTDVGRDPSP